MKSLKDACTTAGTLTVPQMAQWLHLSETTIRTYVTSKRYAHLIPAPFKRPGGRRLLWDAREVDAWLRSGRPPTKPVQLRRRGRPTKAEQEARRRAASSTSEDIDPATPGFGRES